MPTILASVLQDSLHLLFPLLASLLFVCGLLFLKRATNAGTNPWTLTLIANVWASFFFSVFWFADSGPVPWADVWQPALVATLYVSGQVGTFWAIQNGDVSIAAPLFGIKVLLVTVLATTLGGQLLPVAIWVAAVLATVGIAMVQSTGAASQKTETEEAGHPAQVDDGAKKRVWFTVLGAMGASLSFAVFDVLVQKLCASEDARWAKSQFLPLMFWSVGLYSLVFLKAFQKEKWAVPAIRASLLLGGMLIALQAMCILFTISTFGDAPRVNVVYSMRGIWGVLLAWATAKIWGGSEADLKASTMSLRLLGAALITASVVIAILFG